MHLLDHHDVVAPIIGCHAIGYKELQVAQVLWVAIAEHVHHQLVCWRRLAAKGQPGLQAPAVGSRSATCKLHSLAVCIPAGAVSETRLIDSCAHNCSCLPDTQVAVWQ